MSIWLAFEDENQQEHHMRWHGHETVESAKKEYDAILVMVLQGSGKIPNTYIYESEEPLYGYIEEEFDPSIFEIFENQ